MTLAVPMINLASQIYPSITKLIQYVCKQDINYSRQNLFLGGWKKNYFCSVVFVQIFFWEGGELSSFFLLTLLFGQILIAEPCGKNSFGVDWICHPLPSYTLATPVALIFFQWAGKHTNKHTLAQLYYRSYNDFCPIINLIMTVVHLIFIL